MLTHRKSLRVHVSLFVLNLITLCRCVSLVPSLKPHEYFARTLCQWSCPPVLGPVKLCKTVTINFVSDSVLRCSNVKWCIVCSCFKQGVDDYSKVEWSVSTLKLVCIIELYFYFTRLFSFIIIYNILRIVINRDTPFTSKEQEEFQRASYHRGSHNQRQEYRAYRLNYFPL